MATYLTRTPSAGSHGTTWTISFWFKNTCADETQEQYLYMGGDNSTNNNMWIRLNGTSRTLYLRNRSGGSNNTVLTTYYYWLISAELRHLFPLQLIQVKEQDSI